MNSVFFKQRAPQIISVLLTLLLVYSFLAPVTVAQTENPAHAPAATEPAATEASAATAQQLAPWFRLERRSVGEAAELLTVFGSLDGLPRRDQSVRAAEDTSDVPLVSIVRDTLGDADRENDRLRYVWALTYTRPGFGKRLASSIPFLYTRVGNKQSASLDKVPPHVFDLASPERDVWRRFLWLGLQNLFINPYGVAARTTVRALRRNAGDFRKAHVIRALVFLSLYGLEAGASSVFTPAEMHEIQGRLLLTEQTLGGLVDDGYLHRVQQNHETAWRDARGHNWYLLRQRAEA